LPEQEQSLQDLGCEIGQGFLFAKPMGVDALVGFLASQLEDADVVPPASNAA
jgi:EAL domain-containing protein (putative c-di-GMP-specific phosphodiesterase class I)